MRWGSDDRGTLSLYVAFLAPAILALSGLVIDGGGALVAKQRAADQAEQAARAGANAIDIGVLRDSGDRQIDCVAAQGLVTGYFAVSRADSHTFGPCSTGRVSVSVTVQYKSIFLGKTFNMTDTASASPICEADTLCVALPRPRTTAPDPQVRR